MLLLFRNRASGGGLPLPPDYNPATDDLWIAQPGYIYSDAAGTALLTGAGNALSWRSLRGTLAVFNAAVAWDGINELNPTGTQWALVNPYTYTSPMTAVVVITRTGTGFQRIIDGSVNNGAIYMNNIQLYAETPSASIIGSIALNLPSVVTGVFDGANSVLRNNGVEVSGTLNSFSAASVRFWTFNNGAGQFLNGQCRAIWLANGRGFDAAQRAANEAAMATLCQVVLP